MLINLSEVMGSFASPRRLSFLCVVVEPVMRIFRCFTQTPHRLDADDRRSAGRILWNIHAARSLPALFIVAFLDFTIVDQQVPFLLLQVYGYLFLGDLQMFLLPECSHKRFSCLLFRRKIHLHFHLHPV